MHCNFRPQKPILSNSSCSNIGALVGQEWSSTEIEHDVNFVENEKDRGQHTILKRQASSVDHYTRFWASAL